MEKVKAFKMGIGLILIGMLFALVVMTYLEIQWLYANADEVECDNFGRCVFKQTLREVEQRCYQNDEPINCSEMQEMMIDEKESVLL